MQTANNFEDLPITLNVYHVARVLGVSIKVAYQLTRQDGFPSIRVGPKRICIPRDRFIEWINQCADKLLE